MSEDKRKNARLQGRFSDEHKPSKKEKKKIKNEGNRQDDPSSSTKGKNSSLKPSQAAEGYDLKHDGNSKVIIEQIQEKKKPVELGPGVHVLSSTENGTSRVIFEPDFIPRDEADELFTILNHATQWYDKNIIIHGKEIPQPRLVAWYGPYPYAYSGAILDPLEMSPKLLTIKDKIEKYLPKWSISASFNSVLLNLYRNEKDSVAWHSDDELSLGLNPTIASVSLGEVRKFEMLRKSVVRDSNPDLVSTHYTTNLTPGSLIIMDGSMQKDWKHQVPKEYHSKGPRINLTFRTVHSKDEIPTQVPLKTLVNSKNSSNSKTEDREHIFDNSNFPPLGASNSEKDHKVFHSLSQTKIKSNVEVPCINKNSVLNSNENKSESQITELNTDIQEENVPSQDTDFTSTPCSELTNNEHLFVPTEETGNQNVSVEEILNHPVPELQEQSEVSSLISEEETNHNHTNKRFQLNVEATEFVPKNHFTSNGSYPPMDINYHKLDILDLAELFASGKVSYPQFEDFSKALNDRIYENGDMFTTRDHHELDVLCNINDNTQIENNRKRILARLCSMIKYAAKSNTVPRSVPSHYAPRSSNRTGYRDNYRPRNNSYRSTSYKGKGFKD